MRADDTAFIQVSLSWFVFLRGVRPLVSKNRLCRPTAFVCCSAVVGSAKSSPDGNLKQLSVDSAPSMRKSFEVRIFLSTCPNVCSSVKRTQLET